MSTSRLSASVVATRRDLESLVEVEATSTDGDVWQVVANLWEDGELRLTATRLVAAVAVKGYMDRIRREYRDRAAHRVALLDGEWSPIYSG